MKIKKTIRPKLSLVHNKIDGLSGSNYSPILNTNNTENHRSGFAKLD